MVDLVPWLLVQHVLNQVRFEGFELREEILFLLIAAFFNFQIHLSLKWELDSYNYTVDTLNLKTGQPDVSKVELECSIADGSIPFHSLLTDIQSVVHFAVDVSHAGCSYEQTLMTSSGLLYQHQLSHWTRMAPVSH